MRVPLDHLPRTFACVDVLTVSNAYSLNNITAKKGADGSTYIQFGGCGGEGG